MMRSTNVLLICVVLTCIAAQVNGVCLDNRLRKAVKKGVDWVLSKRTENWGWAERGEAEMVMSLQLTDNDWFELIDADSSASVKQMNVDLLSAMLRHGQSLNTSSWFGGKLGQYINGLVATCQNPRDFHGVDLVALLKTHMDEFPSYFFNHNFAFSWAVLGLCAAQEQVSQTYVTQLTSNAGGPYGFGVDEASMTIMAMSCINVPDEQPLNDAVQFLFDNRDDNDGSFGNEFSTALAVQALFASGKDSNNAIAEGQAFLLNSQGEDGSFKNLLAANHILPAFAKTSFAAIKDTNFPCTAPEVNPPQTCGPQISISIIVENLIQAPIFTHTFLVTFNDDANLFEFLLELARVDPGFTFTYQQTLYGASIESLLGLAGVGADRTYFRILSNGFSLGTGVSGHTPADGEVIKFEFTQY